MRGHPKRAGGYPEMRILLALLLLHPVPVTPGACADGRVPLFHQHTIIQVDGYIRMIPAFGC